MNELKVQGIDNRGGDEFPYGFVYFTDDTRVGFTKEVGVDEEATGGWGPVSPAHVTLAEDTLRELGMIA